MPTMEWGLSKSLGRALCRGCGARAPVVAGLNGEPPTVRRYALHHRAATTTVSLGSYSVMCERSGHVVPEDEPVST